MSLFFSFCLPSTIPLSTSQNNNGFFHWIIGSAKLSRLIVEIELEEPNTKIMDLDQMIVKVRNKCVPSVRVKRNYSCYKENAEDLKIMLTDVVLNRGSDAVLVSGPRNSGKTMLVESVVSEFNSSCHVIRLSGVLCTNFMSSLEELSYQLKVEEEFANLLATESFTEGRTEILTFIKGALDVKSKPIVLILDQIELFCEHRGQALLYNLLDIIRSEEKPICLIGMTACQEIWELFEKRVKSRFGHRIIYVKPLQFENYQNFALDLVQLENCDVWNRKMKKLLKDNSVVRVLEQLHNTDNSIGTLCRFLYNVCLHCEFDSDLTPHLISELYEDTLQGHRVKQCLDLNLNELLVILTIFKITKNGVPTFTYNNIFDTIQKAGAACKLSESDIRFSLKKLEEHRLICSTDKSHLYYRAEMDHQELVDVSKNCKLPSEFQGLL